MKIVTASCLSRPFAQFLAALPPLSAISTLSLLSGNLLSLALLSPAQAGAFDPPPGQGVPGGTVGGGSRTLQCLSSSSALPSALPSALAPSRQIGMTDRDHPRFWVYLPPHEATHLEFSLYDQDHNGLYQVILPVAAGADLQPIDLPIGAPALAPQATYQWTVALICNPERRTQDWVMGGWIQRAPIGQALAQQLAQAQGIERVQRYAQGGFWYEALDQMLALQQAQPQSPALQSSLVALLQSAGLDQVASEMGSKPPVGPVRWADRGHTAAQP
jgi:Domain of Unknown Function (DUF928)